MAARFLNSLSSIMYAGQIFGIMPVLRRRRRRRKRRRLQQSSSANTVCRIAPVTMTVLNLHDERVFGEDDANGIVNITDTSDKDYVKSDKSSDEEEHTTDRYVTQFNWKCSNTVYSVLIIVLGTGEWLCTVHEIIHFGLNLGTIGSFNFYTIANFALIMFFNSARNWSSLFLSWTNVARVFEELPYRSGRINASVKIRWIFCLWTLVAVGELMCALFLLAVCFSSRGNHVLRFPQASPFPNMEIVK